MKTHRQAIEEQVNHTDGVLKELKAARITLASKEAEYRKAKAEAGMNLEFGIAKTEMYVVCWLSQLLTVID